MTSDTKEFMPWSPELSVGLQEIDEQHKVLVNLINKLFNEAILKKPDHAIIDGVLTELTQYTIIHFAVEESLFRIFDYPDNDSHQQQHERLKSEVVKIQKKFKDGTVVDIELMHFIKKWLKQHIMIEDKKYTPFFLEKGFKSNWSKQRSWVGKIWDSIYLK